MPCLGLARAMGLTPERRLIQPRAFFAMLAPRGPIDPKDAPGRVNSPLAPPFPDIAFAAGRRTIPYLRRLKRASAGKTFTVFLGDPRIGPHIADAIWAPVHDRIRGPNVIVTPTAPHILSPQALDAARAHPDPRIATLPAPRVALLVGGPSRHHAFDALEQNRLIEAARAVLASGASLMATASRRTPPALVVRLRALAAQTPRAFVWAGEGDNPYVSLLALADEVIVTADSTNMVGEAVATAAPVHIFKLAGGHPRLDAFVGDLVASGRVRDWSGAPGTWAVRPVDATPAIADEIGRRFAVFQQGRGTA
jgi:mitochondrial fission protein ELM1